MMKYLFCVLYFIPFLAQADSFPGFRQKLIHNSSIGCRPMNAQILSKDGGNDFYVSIGGYCLNGTDFYKNIKLKDVKLDGEKFIFNDIYCGDVNEVEDILTVKLNNSACFFTMNKRKTYLSTFHFAGGGEFLGILPSKDITGYGVKKKIILDAQGIPLIVIGKDWESSTQTFSMEYIRFNSSDLTFKGNEIFYRKLPCGFLDKDLAELNTWTNFKRYYNNCKIHHQYNHEGGWKLFLLSNAPREVGEPL